MRVRKLSDSKWFNVKINHDKIYTLKRRKAPSNRKVYKDVEELNDTKKANTASHKKKKRKQMINNIIYQSNKKLHSSSSTNDG